jgi:hypothetical protein
MTDKSNPEDLEKVETEKLALSAEDSSNELSDPCADKANAECHGVHRPTKAAKSKREIMEELSRERFPWEE